MTTYCASIRFFTLWCTLAPLAAFHSPAPITPRARALEAFSVPDVVTDFYQTQPYISAFLTCSLKASAADWVAQGRQSIEESLPDKVDAPVDISRNLAFFAYGGLYQGCTQQYIFVNLYPEWFGSWDVVSRVAAQVGMDVFVLGPCLCLPAAYCIRSLVCSDSTSLMGILKQYWDDVVHQQLIFKYWALWVPVNAIAFGVVPTHFRVLFIAAVSFFWVLLLSLTAAEGEKSRE